jgi:hypothetical protein
MVITDVFILTSSMLVTILLSHRDEDKYDYDRKKAI